MKISTYVTVLGIGVVLMVGGLAACGGSKSGGAASPADSSSSAGGGVIAPALAEKLAKPLIACGGTLDGAWKVRGFAIQKAGGGCTWVNSLTEGRSEYTFEAGKISIVSDRVKAKGFVPACFNKKCSEIAAPQGQLSCSEVSDGCACEMALPNSAATADYAVDGQHLIMKAAGQELDAIFCVEGSEARWNMAGMTMLLARP